MSVIVALLLKVVGSAILVGFAWPYIRDFFSTFLIPNIRKYISNTIADGVSLLLSWLDGSVSMVRKAVKEIFDSFTYHVLGVRASYKRETVHTAGETVTTYIREGDGSVKELVRERSISMDDLPHDIRSEMIRSNAPIQGDDMKSEFEKKVKDKLGKLVV